MDVCVAKTDVATFSPLQCSYKLNYVEHFSRFDESISAMTYFLYKQMIFINRDMSVHLVLFVKVFAFFVTLSD